MYYMYGKNTTGKSLYKSRLLLILHCKTVKFAHIQHCITQVHKNYNKTFCFVAKSNVSSNTALPFIEAIKVERIWEERQFYPG